jgi:hypothetical protein
MASSRNMVFVYVGACGRAGIPLMLTHPPFAIFLSEDVGPMYSEPYRQDPDPCPAIRPFIGPLMHLSR